MQPAKGPARMTTRSDTTTAQCTPQAPSATVGHLAAEGGRTVDGKSRRSRPRTASETEAMQPAQRPACTTTRSDTTTARHALQAPSATVGHPAGEGEGTVAAKCCRTGCRRTSDTGQMRTRYGTASTPTHSDPPHRQRVPSPPCATVTALSAAANTSSTTGAANRDPATMANLARCALATSSVRDHDGDLPAAPRAPPSHQTNVRQVECGGGRTTLHRRLRPHSRVWQDTEPSKTRLARTNLSCGGFRDAGVKRNTHGCRFRRKERCLWCVWGACWGQSCAPKWRAGRPGRLGLFRAQRNSVAPETPLHVHSYTCNTHNRMS